MSDIGDLYSAVGNIGFPIAIAIYLLIRFEKRIESLKQSIDQLGQAIRENNYRKAGDKGG